jgi:hypothetical protein
MIWITNRSVVCWLAALSLLCFLGAATWGQQTPPQKLTNADIIKMTHDGFAEGVMVALIEGSGTAFDVSLNGLNALKDAGVSSKVMEAMLKAEARNKKQAANGGSSGASNQDSSSADPSSASASSPSSASAPPTWSQPPAAQPAMTQPSTTPPPAPAPVTQATPVAPTMVPNPAMSGMAAMPGMGANVMVQQMMASVMGGRMPGGMAGMPGMLDMSQLPPVTLVNGDTKQNMKPSMAQIASTQTKGDGMPGAGSAAMGMMMGLGRQALSFGAIGGGMFAGPAAGMAMSAMGGLGGMGRHHGPPKVTYVWALPGPRAANVVANRKPRFEMEYGNLLGIDPDAYEPFIVKLVPSKDNWRLVGATKSQMGQMSTEAYEKVTEVRVKSKYEKIGRGQMQVEPTEALEPGEYGLVLRALHPGKRASGSLGGPAEQTVFFSVWDFAVR